MLARRGRSNLNGSQRGMSLLKGTQALQTAAGWPRQSPVPGSNIYHLRMGGLCIVAGHVVLRMLAVGP